MTRINGDKVIDQRRYFKLLRSQGIDSKELIPPVHEAWRPGTTTVFLLGSYIAPIDYYKIPVLQMNCGAHGICL